MSLDDELRSAFERETRTRPAPPPDLAGLIAGGRTRRRRRNLERVGAAIAAALVIGAGGYALVPDSPGDPGVAARPSDAPTSSPPVDQGRPELAPGTYRVFVGRGSTGARIDADFTVDGVLTRVADRPRPTGGRDRSWRADGPRDSLTA